MNDKSLCIICNTLSKLSIFNNLEMFSCPACGLVWLRNQDVSLIHYQKKKVDFADKKINSRTRDCYSRMKSIRRYSSLNNLCDIGCGEGTFLKVLMNNGYKNVIGIDPSSQVQYYIKKNKVDFFQGKLEDITNIVGGKNISIFTMFHVIEHLDNPRKALSLVYDSLPVGGFLVLETPLFDNYCFRRLKFRHKLIYREHFFYFTFYNLSKLLEDLGFTIVSRELRDFDQWNLSIEESLFRLGLVSPDKFTKKRAKSILLKSIAKNGTSLSPRKMVLIIKGYLLITTRLILNLAVVLLGRLNYGMVIVRK